MKPTMHADTLRFTLLLLLILALPANPHMEAGETPQSLQVRNSYWLQHTDAQNSLYHYISEENRSILKTRSERVAQLQSLSDWQDYQQKIASTLMEIVGPFPEKTPLNPTVTRIIQKDQYRIEHIIYESQPQLYVTASLYLPDSATTGGTPAIIYCSGHSWRSYRGRGYQRKILNLVQKGFIVLAFDPFGQGERARYFPPEVEPSLFRGATLEHSYPGAQAFITGSSLARHMIWDGIRAVDYLLTRPEVDPDRIGITGRSGGGTQTAQIAAMDPRIHAAAPEAYISNYTRRFQSGGIGDAEQNFYHGIASGIDNPELLIARAPKPTLVISTINDYVSLQGARETFKEVSRFYAAYGESDNLSMVEDIGGHHSTQRNREAMYAFFQKHLANPGSSEDLDVEFLEDDELTVTETGRVAGISVFNINKEESKELLHQLESARKEPETHLTQVKSMAKKLSGYREPEVIGSPVFSQRVEREGYSVDAYFLEEFSNYIIPYLLVTPENPNGSTVLYVHTMGKAAEAGIGGEIERLAQHGYTVLAPDLLGIGETGPGDYRGDSYIGGTSYNLWFGTVLAGRSIAGIRAEDLVRLTRLITRDFSDHEVCMIVRGNLSAAALHAVAFEPMIARLALLEPTVSYRSIVMNRLYDPTLIHGAVAGSLIAYDLPDLAGLIAPRNLMILNPIDGTLEDTDPDGLQEDLAIMQSFYNHSGSPESLEITTVTDTVEALLDWLGSKD